MPNDDRLRAITDDTYQLVLPLPFALNSVNIYLLRGEDGWTVLDCGLHTPEAAVVWEKRGRRSVSNRMTSPKSSSPTPTRTITAWPG